jgi:ATP-dependent helicase/nuclease subunit A
LTGSVPPRAIEAKDILILLQKRGPLFTALISAFRKLGVPVSGADRLVLNKSLAVQDVLALLQVLVMPEDDLALAAVLKSPLVPNPVSEQDLYELAHDRVGSLWQNLIAQSPVNQNAFVLLGDAEFSEAHGPYDVIARVLSRSRKAMVERLGVEALDATDILLDQAMEFEAQEGRSITGFIHWFSNSETSVKRELDQEQNQVRLMTVHGAKGLEANIVIMPDAHLAAAGRGTSLLESPQATTGEIVFPLLNIATDVKVDLLNSWKDHSKFLNVAEKKRLLYVAMTRARDELYIGGIQPGSLKKKRELDDDSWYALVSDALAKPGERMKLRECDTGHPEGAVQRHGADPIWIAATQRKDEHADSDLPTWLTTPFHDVPQGVFQKFTGRDGIEDAAERAALQRGQVIHKFLERLRTGDSASVLAARAKRLGLDGAFAQRLAALAEAADTAQLFSAAAQSEVSIAGLKPNGQKIERRIDRLLVTESHIFVLDFKSERDPPPQVPARYVAQVTEYVAVLREAYPDRAVRSAILWTETGRLDWLNIP